MAFVKRFNEGSVIPWQYGYVRYDMMTNQFVVALIPFHVVLRAWGLIRLAWWSFQWYGRREDRFNDKQMRLRAFEDGFEMGRAEGQHAADLQYRPIVLELQEANRKLLDMERTLKALQTISHAIK